MQKTEHLSIPVRKGPSGDQVETRPLYVEEWLDSLPYIDFRKTSHLLYEAVKATNQQSVKPVTRLELVGLYNRPYQYYLSSQIKTGARHTLQSIENMQSQTAILKQIAVNLGLACKLAADESLKRKTLWRQSKPPLVPLLMSMKYLSHALIFSFLEYAPTPKNVWRELNFIYSFAESLNQENNTLILPAGESAKETTTIADTYKRIALASLADPNHLPFGAIWEIYGQLQDWADMADIKKFSTPDNPAGYFVVNLDDDTRPVPFSKFDITRAGEKHRLIITDGLEKHIQKYLGQLDSGSGLDESIRISPYFAKSILSHINKAWGLPPERGSPRQTGKGIVHLTTGLNAAYYFMREEKEFNPHIIKSNDGFTDSSDFNEEHEITPLVNYMIDSWNLVDKGARGFAVIKNDKPKYNVRVGDLVALGYSKTADNKPEKWILGVIRWLMIKQGKIYKIGVQNITNNAQPAALRARKGSESDCQFQRAFIVSDIENLKEASIITDKGLYQERRELELNYKNKNILIQASSLLESSMSFERFRFTNH